MLKARIEFTGDYDTDIVAWSGQQAGLLRRRAAGELVNDASLGWSNIAEEIESVGRSERSALRSHIGSVLEHLIKLEASSATDPRNGWKQTIRRARDDIESALDDRPSMRGLVGGMVADGMPRSATRVARALADIGEQPRVNLHRGPGAR